MLVDVVELAARYALSEIVHHDPERGTRSGASKGREAAVAAERDSQLAPAEVLRERRRHTLQAAWLRRRKRVSH